MPDTYFELRGGDGARIGYRANAVTAGPWDRNLQHGGPPGALLVHAAEQAAAGQTGRSDLVAVRYAAEFVGPVPVGELEVETDVLRTARTAVLVAAAIRAAGRICLSARVWLVRDADTSAIAPPVGMPLTPPEGLPGLAATFPYGNTIEWRTVSGGIDQAGPGVVWARPRTALLAGEQLSGLQRAVLIGDSASGISSVLDWSVWTFLNIDLDVHLARPVSGPWLLMDAVTQLGPNGSALARSTLSDAAGEVGSTAQTLVVAPRR